MSDLGKVFFVTGSAGFIGRRFCTMATEAGHTVIGVDIKTGVDLTDFKQAQDAFLGTGPAPDAVVHLAGDVSTPGSLDRPWQTLQNNLMTTANMMQICRVLHVPLHLTSSVKARDGMTPYGASKRMAEIWANEHRNAYNMKICINRPGTVYGPGQEGSLESGWIAWFLKAKREGLPVVINGTGKQTRDLLHVDDYCRLLLFQLDQMDYYGRGGLWDVGGGHVNMVSVVEMAVYLGLEFSHGPPRYGDAYQYVGKNNIEPEKWHPEIHWRDSGMFD